MIFHLAFEGEDYDVDQRGQKKIQFDYETLNQDKCLGCLLLNGDLLTLNFSRIYGQQNFYIGNGEYSLRQAEIF